MKRVVSDSPEVAVSSDASKGRATPGGRPAEGLLQAIGGDQFPARGSVGVLRERVRAHLDSAAVRPGQRFPTDEELVGASRLSRSTVRRAMAELQREGWICREAGRGSFVGPRAAVDGAGAGGRGAPARAGARQPAEGREEREESVTRLALHVANVGDASHDWFTPQVIAGIESEAEANGVRTELIGQRVCDPAALARRLERSSPDVLVCMSYGPQPGLTARDARGLGLPVVMAGEQYPQPGTPTVVEDNRQGMALAVRHLVEAGHRRIGAALNTEGHIWTVDRCRSFFETAAALGADPDSRLLHWADVSHANPGDLAADHLAGEVDRLARYLDDRRPTALICGSSPVSRLLGLLASRRRLSLPGELSVVGFDQNPLVDAWLGLAVTSVELPLREMGRRIARLARHLREGVAVPERTVLSCGLREGRSVVPGPAATPPPGVTPATTDSK